MPTMPASGPTCLPRSGSGLRPARSVAPRSSIRKDNTVTGMQRFVDVSRYAQAAFGPDEYVEQESFIRASEIRKLAEHAAVGRGVSVLDLCCGVGGPGRFLTRELGCDYLGVDASASAVAVARERAARPALPLRGGRDSTAAAG